MKPTPRLLALALAFVSLSASAEPQDWVGKRIPQMKAGETVYLDVRILAVSAETVTIQHRGGRAELQLADLSESAQQALGYDPAAVAEAKNSRSLYLEVLQSVEGGWLVRERIPATRSGAISKLTAQVTGRAGRDTVGDTVYFLEGESDLSVADGDLLEVKCQRTDRTKEFTRVTGGTATVRVLELREVRRYVP